MKKLGFALLLAGSLSSQVTACRAKDGTATSQAVGSKIGKEVEFIHAIQVIDDSSLRDAAEGARPAPSGACWYRGRVRADELSELFGETDGAAGTESGRLASLSKKSVPLTTEVVDITDARKRVAERLGGSRIPRERAGTLFEASLGKVFLEISDSERADLTSALSNLAPLRSGDAAAGGPECASLLDVSEPVPVDSQPVLLLAGKGDSLNCRRYNFTQSETRTVQGRRVTVRATQTYWTSYVRGRPKCVFHYIESVVPSKRGRANSKVDTCVAFGGGAACDRRR